MQRRLIRATPVVILACAISAGAWACDAGSMAGDAMVDAGGMLADAGATVRDAMGADAAAQDFERDVACDVERTSVTDNGTVTTTQTSWYAELRDPGIVASDVQAVRTQFCDFEYFGPAAEPCDENPACVGVDPQAPPLRCRVGSFGEVEDGLVRVQCGSRHEFTGALERVSGQRPRSVRITVVR